MCIILVTGCAGFVGSHVAKAMLEEGHDVVGLDNFWPNYSQKLKKLNLAELKKSKRFIFVRGSILDKTILDKIEKMRINIISHQAGISGVRKSIKDPKRYMETNTKGTLMLLDKFRDIDRFIFASSSSVYGEVPIKELPVSENRKPNPISPYALSKLHAEKWCEMFRFISGLKTVILRYFTVYGPGQRPDEAITKFITKALKGDKIEIYGDGNQTRDFTYVKDVVGANISALSKGSGIYNIGSGRSVTVNRLVGIIEKAIGTPIKIKRIGKQAGDVSHTLSDIRKAKKELDWKPKTSLEEGLKKTFEYYAQ